MDISKLITFPLLAATITFLLMPLVRKLSIKYGMVAVPNEARKIHKTIIPSAGGIAIFLGFLLAVILVDSLTIPMIGFLVGCLVVTVMGTVDERVNLSPFIRIFFQLVAAGIVIYTGLRIDIIGNFGAGNDGLFFLGPLSIPISLLWIVGITNAINFLDGLDGLAAGVTAIASVTLGIVSYLTGSYSTAILCFILAGSAIAYLPYNFTNDSKWKTFMGDGGSNLMGFSLATLAIMGEVKVAATFSILIPIMVLAVPIFDTLFAIFRRLMCGQSPFKADRLHLHHRILDRGLSQYQATFIIYGACLLLGGIAIASINIPVGELPVLFAIVAIIFLLALWKLGLITIGRVKKR